MAKSSKSGRTKNKPAFARWKDRFNRGLGLKHRKQKRLELELAKVREARAA